MGKKRKIELVINKISFAEAEEDDIEFWANKTIKERLTEAYEWNKNVWEHLLGVYPEKIELTGGKFLKANTEEDDF